MKVVVCVKQIPDPATPYRLEAGTNWLIRPEDQILDDTDRYGVEMGLQLASAGDGTVTLVSMGPAGNGQGIRQAMAMGADDAILIEDDSLRARTPSPLPGRWPPPFHDKNSTWSSPAPSPPTATRGFCRRCLLRCSMSPP